MSEKLTREQIAKVKDRWAQLLDSPEPSLKELAERQVALCNMALAGLEIQPRPLRELQGRVAVITRLDRDTDEPFYIIVHKHVDGRWRESGAHTSCGSFDDSEPAISLPEPK